MQEMRFSEFCANCRRSLAKVEAVLFVEKELGRCFCSEECIQEYFQPTVDAMLEDLERLRPKGDYGNRSTGQFAQYRALTLEDPDEVWMNQLESGERHFTFIGHYRSGEERFSYVCVCLTIDGMPSFVFLGFATHDEELVEQYRQGTEIKLPSPDGTATEMPDIPEIDDPMPPRESLLSESQLWESIFNGEGVPSNDLRRSDDIPKEQFPDFAQFVEPTIDDPDEIWTLQDPEGRKWLTFISIYKDAEEDENYFSMIAVCRLREDNSLEMVSAFPTVDPEFAQKFRKGLQSLNKAFGVGWARGRAA